MTRILVNVKEDELAAADAAAKRLGVSRSEVVRRALARFVSGKEAPVESVEERLRRVNRVLEEMKESGRQMKKIDPTWDPVALIRAHRDGKIRL
ncbi:MAG: ribbon-helix-helix protein, CopG family [Candidatus Coatesbacteria bacterium]